LIWIVTPPPTEYCDERVCLSVCVCLCVCVCLFAIISSELHVRSSPNFCACYCGRGSVVIWRLSDKLYTSGFMDYAIFAHKPRLLDVAAQQKHSAHAALGLAVKWLHGTTFWALKVTSQVATPGRSLQSMTALFTLELANSTRCDASVLVLLRTRVSFSTCAVHEP